MTQRAERKKTEYRKQDKLNLFKIHKETTLICFLFLFCCDISDFNWNWKKKYCRKL